MRAVCGQTESKLADVYVFSQQTEIKSKKYDDYFIF